MCIYMVNPALRIVPGNKYRKAFQVPVLDK
jgi:hypothetical protein